MTHTRKQELTMKRTLFISATAFITAACSIFYFVKNTETAPTTNKNINVEVYKTASYVSAAYSNTTASLQVTVIRVKKNVRDTVWQHSFQPTELKDYPEVNKPITQKILIPNVNDAKEQLEIYYSVTYNSKGNILNYWNYTTVGRGQQDGKLAIQI